jgi:NO-binding membrane sensor protein with MHYT domain
VSVLLLLLLLLLLALLRIVALLLSMLASSTSISLVQACAAAQRCRQLLNGVWLCCAARIAGVQHWQQHGTGMPGGIV